MAGTLRISAKNLGELALDSFCPRCTWLKLRMHHQFPYQIFPGIFSSIDSYTKHVVHGWIDQHGDLPEWLSELGEIDDYIDPPHHSQFQVEIPEFRILLTGSPDGMLKLVDGSIAIIDYKTAKYTANQDSLMPMYEAQLNAYALIAERRGFSPVSKLALIYAEPVTDELTATQPGIHSAGGFVMPFSVYIHPVKLDPARLFPLFRKAREIFDLAEAPPGRPGCKDCEKLDKLLSWMGR